MFICSIAVLNCLLPSCSRLYGFSFNLLKPLPYHSWQPMNTSNFSRTSAAHVLYKIWAMFPNLVLGVLDVLAKLQICSKKMSMGNVPGSFQAFLPRKRMVTNPKYIRNISEQFLIHLGNAFQTIFRCCSAHFPTFRRLGHVFCTRFSFMSETVSCHVQDVPDNIRTDSGSTGMFQMISAWMLRWQLPRHIRGAKSLARWCFVLGGF